MAKFGRFVRLKGTSLEGRIMQRLIHNGEEVFIVGWDMSANNESVPLTASQLEGVDFEDTRAHTVIRHAFAHDRKIIEEDSQDMGGGTVEAREVFRSRTFQRI